MNPETLIWIFSGVAVGAVVVCVVATRRHKALADEWMRKALAYEHQRDRSDEALRQAQERADRLQRELRAETDRTRRLSCELSASRQDNTELRAQIVEIRGPAIWWPDSKPNNPS